MKFYHHIAPPLYITLRILKRTSLQYHSFKVQIVSIHFIMPSMMGHWVIAQFPLLKFNVHKMNSSAVMKVVYKLHATSKDVNKYDHTISVATISYHWNNTKSGRKSAKNAWGCSFVQCKNLIFSCPHAKYNRSNNEFIPAKFQLINLSKIKNAKLIKSNLQSLWWWSFSLQQLLFMQHKRILKDIGHLNQLWKNFWE